MSCVQSQFLCCCCYHHIMQIMQTAWQLCLLNEMCLRFTLPFCKFERHVRNRKSGNQNIICFKNTLNFNFNFLSASDLCFSGSNCCVSLHSWITSHHCTECVLKHSEYGQTFFFKSKVKINKQMND